MALAICTCSGGGGNSGNGVPVAQSPTPTPTPTPTTPPPPLANLPSWVNALAIGQWAQVSNTALSSVEPSPVPDGNTGPQSKVVAWTSFVVDTRTSKVYSVAGGGHTDYAGNEVDELTLETDTPAWTQRLAPTPGAQLTNCQSYYGDDRPAARHSYYGVTLDTTNDRIMLFGGAEWCVNGGFHSAISSYNIGANQYSPSSTHGSVGNFGNGVSAYAVDPLTGNVYAAKDFAFGRWNRSTNTFSTLSPTGSPAAGNESMSAMDTTRGRILFAGGQTPGGDHHTYTISSNTFTAISLNGANAANVAAADGAAMVYVDVMDRYLVRLGGVGGTVYQINPTTFEVTTYPTTGGASVPATQNGPYNKFLYVPRLGGVIYAPTYSGNVWFMRIR